MSDVSPGENENGGESTSSSQTSSTSAAQDAGSNVSEKFNEVMSTINETLGKVDWSQMGKYGKALGIIAIVIVAQVLIKAILDTINFLPIIPGLLELLGVVVLGQWSWQNLTTSEKRNSVLEKVQDLRKEYLG